MKAKAMDLVWIVVEDLKKAVHFYTEVVGLKLKDFHEQYGWAELQGEGGGARLGLAQQCPTSPYKAGEKTVITFTVADLAAAKKKMLNEGAECVGEVEEVPGQVKTQMVRDRDNNLFQLVELLSS